MADYSLYKYYKGSEDYPNKKAAFFGFYERSFELTYRGRPEDKEEAFKAHMCDLLYEQASDIYMFGTPGVDRDKCYQEYLKIYFNPKLNLNNYEP